MAFIAHVYGKVRDEMSPIGPDTDRGIDARAREHNHDHGHDHDHGVITVLRMVAVVACAAAVWFEVPDAYPPVMSIGDQVFIPFSYYAWFGLAFGGWPIFRGGVESIRERTMTMELSMSLAILAGAYGGYFFAALIITFFVLIAEVLEGMTIERGRRAIRELLELLPREVSVRREGRIKDINVFDLAVGDIVLVAPGARIPVDGTVIDGHSFVDESQITGESAPAEKVPGAAAFAGTINQSGALEIKTQRIGRETSYGKIIEAVEHAEHSRAPIQRLSDRMAGYIVCVAFGFAAFEYYLTKSLIDAVTVIIVAGACGVAAGTPLAILGGIGRAARLGAIIKGGVHLEVLGKVDTVVLDKTGTLTFGQPELQRIVPVEGISAAAVLDAAVTAEIRSEHPFAKAILRYAGSRVDRVTEPDSFKYVPGRGISASAGEDVVIVGSMAWLRDNQITVPRDIELSTGDISQVLVARNGHLLGAIEIVDQLRPEAQSAVEALKRMRIRTILLTGDGPAVAEAVGRQLGIEEVEASLLPDMKVARVRDLVGQGRTVAMVGDGINDAPALAVADVGVAMGSGTDVARECADIVLLGNDLARFVETVALARRAGRIIWFNFAGTVLVDVIGVTLVFMGYVGPVLAAVVHTGSELTFILNSARLLPGASIFEHAPWSRLTFGRARTVQSAASLDRAEEVFSAPARTPPSAGR